MLCIKRTFQMKNTSQNINLKLMVQLFRSKHGFETYHTEGSADGTDYIVNLLRSCRGRKSCVEAYGNQKVIHTPETT